MDRLSHDVILSRKSVQRKVEMRLKCDTRECEIESKYDPIGYVVNFLTRIKLEYVYGNIGHACLSSGKCIFDANM